MDLLIVLAALGMGASLFGLRADLGTPAWIRRWEQGLIPSVEAGRDPQGPELPWQRGVSAARVRDFLPLFFGLLEAEYRGNLPQALERILFPLGGGRRRGFPWEELGRALERIRAGVSVEVALQEWAQYVYLRSGHEGIVAATARLLEAYGRSGAAEDLRPVLRSLQEMWELRQRLALRQEAKKAYVRAVLVGAPTLLLAILGLLGVVMVRAVSAGLGGM